MSCDENPITDWGTDNDTLVERVRTWIESEFSDEPSPSPTYAEPLAALDEIAERLKAAEAEAELKRIETHHANAKREVAERHYSEACSDINHWIEKVEAAEAQRDREKERADKLLDAYVETQEQAAELLAAAIRLCNAHKWSYGGPETLIALANRIKDTQ